MPGEGECPGGDLQRAESMRGSHAPMTTFPLCLLLLIPFTADYYSAAMRQLTLQSLPLKCFGNCEMAKESSIWPIRFLLLGIQNQI